MGSFSCCQRATPLAPPPQAAAGALLRSEVGTRAVASQGWPRVREDRVGASAAQRARAPVNPVQERAAEWAAQRAPGVPDREAEARASGAAPGLSRRAEPLARARPRSP